MPERVDHPLPQYRRFEQPAVEEHDVRPGRVLAGGQADVLHGHVPVCREKGRQVTCHRRVGRERQSELLESGTAATRPSIERHQGKEAFHQQFVNFAPQDLDLPRPPINREPDQGRLSVSCSGAAGPKSVSLSCRLRCTSMAHCRGSNLPPPPVASDGAKMAHPLPSPLRPFLRLSLSLLPCSLLPARQLLFQVVRQGKIEIIAAEDQMITDGHAVELDLAAFAAADADQREVGRAPADIADEDLLARLDKLVPSVAMGVDPGIESGLRLFDQHHPRQAGQRGRLDRQLPRHFIEGGRQREHEILLGQRMLRKAGVPSGADVGQVPRADFDRR